MVQKNGTRMYLYKQIMYINILIINVFHANTAGKQDY